VFRDVGSVPPTRASRFGRAAPTQLPNVRHWQVANYEKPTACSHVPGFCSTMNQVETGAFRHQKNYRSGSANRGGSNEKLVLETPASFEIGVGLPST